MPKMKVTPKAKYPDQTQKFIRDVCDALEEFEENVRFPDEEIREDVYRVLLEAYHTALTSIWSLAQFADIETILKTIADKQMTELTIMSKKLAPPLLLVQVFPLTNMHLVLHAHLFILIRNCLPHIVNLHCMYKHPLST